MASTKFTRRQWMAGATALATPLAAAGRPNILYMLADDLGWHDVSYHGSEIRTPHIDRLASASVELNRFYACPVCSPARASILTGRSPMRYGMIYSVLRPWDTHGIPLAEKLMPEAFHDAGYQTWMVGKWHLGHWNARIVPNARGFDHYYGHVNGDIDYFEHVREGALDWQRNGKPVVEPGYSTDLFAAEAVRLIEGRDRARPFFFYLPFNAPHQPLMAPQPLMDRYRSIADPKRRTYAAMVTALDDAIGRVLDALERTGAARNTIVIFHSDNGAQTLQGGQNIPLRAGKSTVFEGGIRVPALVHYAGVLPEGVRSEQVMTILDMFPTLAAAAGIPTGNSLPLDGRNLWPALTASTREPREDLFFAVGERGYWRHAIIRRDWKLVREQSQADGSLQSLLFQIEEDPLEEKNLATAHPELVRDLTARIEQWRALHPPGDIPVSSKRHPGFVPPKQWTEAAIR
jgi:arylsulfatase A-like enzyme